MPNYIINKNEDNNGKNEVHNTGSCVRMPLQPNQVSLGWQNDAKVAVAYAKNNGWKNADGCFYCCNEAHKG